MVLSTITAAGLVDGGRKPEEATMAKEINVIANTVVEGERIFPGKSGKKITVDDATAVVLVGLKKAEYVKKADKKAAEGGK